jgi:protein-histidine pros-kinase
VRVGILAAVYFGTATVGLSLAVMHPNVTLVWPPTGIALAALLLFGGRLWPGIALGAFLANAFTAVPVVTAGGIALGNTLEAVAGAYLLRRVVRFRNSLGRLPDVLGLVVLAAVLSTTVSATIGVASLCLGGAAPWALYGSLWWQWWLGDAMGALVVAPVLLTWGTPPRPSWPARQGAEAAALLVLLVAASQIAFGGWFLSDAPAYPLAYGIFPFVIWAALRFGSRGAATATLVVSGIAVWGTVQQVGPFLGRGLTESLLLLQTFMSVVAVTGLLLAATVTERRRAEGRFRLAVEAAPNAMMMVDREGRITLLNRQVERSFGYTQEELLGRSIETLVPERFRSDHPGHRGRFFAEPQARPMGAGRDLFGRRKDGSEVPVEIGLTPVQTEEGTFVLVSIIDITARKRAEEALQLANTRLQEAVQRAEEASRAKSEFLANMSHELRTPLNSIIGFSALLEQGVPGPLTEKQQRHVGHIHGSGRHLLAIINDILDLSKVEAGRLELHPGPFLVQDALEAAVSDMRPQAEAKGIAVRLGRGEGLGTLWADPVRVKQILYNLVSNAVKFTPAGGQVTVTARRVARPPDPPVEPSRPTDGSGESLVVAITDTGIGIKAEDLGKLFREFAQLDASLAREYGGTGLGLALTKRLVELHGGTVTAASPGKGLGSTFTVTLPLRPPAPRGRILVVEDDDSIRTAVAEALRNAGFEVGEVADGEGALARVTEAPPALLILDLGLPRLHGLEVLRRLRAAGGTRHLPVIVLTGVDPKRVEEVLAQGADEFLAKPFSLPVLLDAVERLLRGALPRGGTRAPVDRAGI